MKTRSKSLVFLVVCTVALGVSGLVYLLFHISRPSPTLTAYLSRHELVTPSNSSLYPDILMEKLALEPMQTWMEAETPESKNTDDVLREVLSYLIVNITLDLPEDPLVQYTHYYHLEIENNSDKLFEDVHVKFPSIEAVEVRRRGYGATMVPQNNGKYVIGNIGPDETVDVYAWNIRPFYLQEENSIILRHGNEPIEILYMKLVGPHRSWIKDNLLLITLLGGLALFLMQKMFFVIRMCSSDVDPKLGKKITLE